MLAKMLECFTHGFAKWVGSASGFVAAVLSIVVWLVVGEITNYPHGWESGIVLYLGIITFLIVFLMQRSQIKEFTILHVKLNELIASTKHADNHLMNIEELTEKEISEVQDIHRQIGTETIEHKA